MFYCGFTVIKGQLRIIISTTVEPQYNEVPRDWQNKMFTITSFCYIEVLFHNYFTITRVNKLTFPCSIEDFVI